MWTFHDVTNTLKFWKIQRRIFFLNGIYVIIYNNIYAIRRTFRQFFITVFTSIEKYKWHYTAFVVYDSVLLSIYLVSLNVLSIGEWTSHLILKQILKLSIYWWYKLCGSNNIPYKCCLRLSNKYRFYNFYWWAVKLSSSLVDT